MIKLKKSDLKKAFLYAVIPLVFGSDFARFSSRNVLPQKDLNVPDTEILRFYVDTIYINKDNYKEYLPMAYYVKRSNQITSLWAKVDSVHMTSDQIKEAKKRAGVINFGLKKLSNLLHERRHQHNHAVYKKVNSKYYHKKIAFLTPEHQAETFIHDEISCNISQLLFARDLYRQGVSLDSIPIPSKSYKSFLETAPLLGDTIGKDELNILAAKIDEWKNDLRDHYSVKHAISAENYYKITSKNKSFPSEQQSEKVLNEILTEYYHFYYHGQYISIPFHRFEINKTVQDVLTEKRRSPDKTSHTLDSLKQINTNRSRREKKGNRILRASQPLPNYNPSINSR